MKCFAGIDVGSTNIKLVVVNEEGEICISSSFATPYVNYGGLRYFDLRKIDTFVDAMIDQAKHTGELVSVGFSSFGESVVPVKDGKALDNPLFWNEAQATSNEEEKAIEKKYSGFTVTGIVPNGVLSLDKILWYRRNHIEKPDFYLPMSTYQVYRKTGCITWCYSQASRSNAYEVVRKSWNYQLLSRLDLDEPGTLGPHGMYCGEKDHVIYGLGGHDHITGLFFVFCLTQKEELVFDSMGTSSSLTLLFSKPHLTASETYNERGGGLVNGFKEEQYIILRGLNRYGSIPAYWMTKNSLVPDVIGYERINYLIASKKDDPIAFTMRVGGNFYNDNRLERGQCEYFNIRETANAQNQVESAYLYNCLKTRQIVEDFGHYAKLEELPFFCGGAASSDSFFMTLKATIVGHEYRRLNIKELCALGGACCGIMASEEEKLFETMKERDGKVRLYSSSEDFKCFNEKAILAYKNLDY